MEPKKILTPDEARQELIRHGISISQWARLHQVDSDTVLYVLAGNPCNFGKSHRVACLLGVKDGVIE